MRNTTVVDVYARFASNIAAEMVGLSSQPSLRAELGASDEKMSEVGDRKAEEIGWIGFEDNLLELGQGWQSGCRIPRSPPYKQRIHTWKLATAKGSIPMIDIEVNGEFS